MVGVLAVLFHTSDWTEVPFDGIVTCCTFELRTIQYPWAWYCWSIRSLGLRWCGFLVLDQSSFLWTSMGNLRRFLCWFFTMVRYQFDRLHLVLGLRDWCWGCLQLLFWGVCTTDPGGVLAAPSDPTACLLLVRLVLAVWSGAPVSILISTDFAATTTFEACCGCCRCLGWRWGRLKSEAIM